jgi:hypothetical protein
MMKMQLKMVRSCDNIINFLRYQGPSMVGLSKMVVVQNIQWTFSIKHVCKT